MSEVARLRKRIELECEAMQRAMTGYAVAGSHEVISEQVQEYWGDTAGAGGGGGREESAGNRRRGLYQRDWVLQSLKRVEGLMVLALSRRRKRIPAIPQEVK